MFKWDVEPGLAFGELTERYTQTIFTRLRFTAEHQAAEMEAYARQVAPWVDRTGAARAGLHATVESSGLLTRITLAHGVDYGIWLEISHGGQNAVIPLVIDKFSITVWNDIQAQFRGAFNAIGNIGPMGNLNP